MDSQSQLSSGIHEDRSKKEQKEFLSSLLRIPSEVLLEIFYSLDLSSILALRASNRIIHALIYRHESDLVRTYFARRLPRQCLRIFPNPDTVNPWSLDYLCETERRLRTCKRLSIIVSDAIAERLKSPMMMVVSMSRRPIRNQSSPLHPLDPCLETRCLEIRPRLTMGLFVLYDFFRSLKEATVKCVKDLQGTMSDIDFSCLTQCLNWDQQDTIERYPDKCIFEAHHIFNILAQVVTCQLGRDTSCANAVKTAFVMGGIEAVDKCLSAKDLDKRTSRFQLAFGEVMDGVGANPPPRRLAKTVRHLASAYRYTGVRDGTITRSSSAIAAFICSQSIWNPSALAVMQRQESGDPWKGNMYRFIDSVVKENGAFEEDHLRIIIRPWDTKALI